MVDNLPNNEATWRLDFSDIEMLATLMIQHMGGKIELVDNLFYVDDEEFSDSDRIVTNNRHSWHANTWVIQIN